MSTTLVPITTVSDLNQLSIEQQVRDKDGDTWTQTGSYRWQSDGMPGHSLSPELLLDFWAPLAWLHQDTPDPAYETALQDYLDHIKAPRGTWPLLRGAFDAGWKASQ